MSNFSQNVRPRLSFSEALNSVFQHYATFQGRARRSEYWWFSLFFGLVNGFFQIVSSSMADKMLSGALSPTSPALLSMQIVALAFGLALFIPSITVGVRRLHDIGKSGWNVWWSLIPIIGQILLLVWMCQDSDPMPNKYGPSPKYITDAEATRLAEAQNPAVKSNAKKAFIILGIIFVVYVLLFIMVNNQTARNMEYFRDQMNGLAIDSTLPDEQAVIDSTVDIAIDSVAAYPY